MPSRLVLGCLLLPTLLLVSVLVYSMSISAIGMSEISNKEVWLLEDHLPENVVTLKSYKDTSVDSMYLVKAKFSAEEDILAICDEFGLQLHPKATQLDSFAEMQDDVTDIPWFPLDQTTRIYYFWPEKSNGEMKENAKGRYEGVLWVDDKKKELILQIATM